MSQFNHTLNKITASIFTPIYNSSSELGCSHPKDGRLDFWETTRLIEPELSQIKEFMIYS